MEIEQEKVYVLVGKDVQEGHGTLGWAFKNWCSKPVSFVILHVSNKSKDFVYTAFGKLPVSSLNDEKLDLFRAREQEGVDKLLCKYLASCSKVNAKVMKVEKSEEPIHKIIIELISSIQIKNLVVGLGLSKSSSCDSFYVHKHKPEFCKLFIVSGGRLVMIREENGEAYFQDDCGGVVAAADRRKKAREKGTSLIGWLGKMLTDINSPKTECESVSYTSSSSSTVGTPEVQPRLEDQHEDMENHRQGLLNSNAMESEEEEFFTPMDSMEDNKLEIRDHNTVSQLQSAERIGALREQTEEAQRMMAKEKKTEVQAHSERKTKAQWATSLSNQRADEMETHVREERAKKAQLEEELEEVRKEMQEISEEITKSKSELRSVHDLEDELRMKLHANSLEKSRIKAELEKAIVMRAETLKAIKEMRRERDMLCRKVEWCMQGETKGGSELPSYSHREFSIQELKDATHDFSETTVICDSPKGKVYKGRINHMDVAIKFKPAFTMQPPEEFNKKVEILHQIRHPHIVAMLGACMDHHYIVFEYLHCGSLHEALFSDRHRRRDMQPFLPWHARINIAAEVCSALGFLHSTRPRPTPYGQLDAAHVLLDQNLVAKISSPRNTSSLHIGIDIVALGMLVIQLLTGWEIIKVEEMQQALKEKDVMRILDASAGDWPLDLAMEFADIGLRYTAEEVQASNSIEFTYKMMNELDELKARVKERRLNQGDHHANHWLDIPSTFICPILQEVMKQPHVAADGFSYELEAIKEWLDCGHETSPMTNLKLKHMNLTPNHTLRSLLSNWHQMTHPTH